MQFVISLINVIHIVSLIIAAAVHRNKQLEATVAQVRHKSVAETVL